MLRSGSRHLPPPGPHGPWQTGLQGGDSRAELHAAGVVWDLCRAHSRKGKLGELGERCCKPLHKLMLLGGGRNHGRTCCRRQWSALQGEGVGA